MRPVEREYVDPCHKLFKIFAVGFGVMYISSCTLFYISYYLCGILFYSITVFGAPETIK